MENPWLILAEDVQNLAMVLLKNVVKEIVKLSNKNVFFENDQIKYNLKLSNIDAFFEPKKLIKCYNFYSSFVLTLGNL